MSDDPSVIWKTIKEKLKGKCYKESCWVKQIAGNNVELMESFAPKSPDSWKNNKNEWLSDSDLSRVMQQYEKIYKCFEFIGPSPIDFDSKNKSKTSCVYNDLCNFSIKTQIMKNKNKIGIIFNLDTHDQPGSHWVSLFINIKKKWIFYFNSTGEPAEKEIKAFVNRVIEEGAQMNPPINFKFSENSPFVHQHSDTECGMYSLYFILQMLKDTKSPNYFRTHRITDKQMEKYRKIYFNEDL